MADKDTAAEALVITEGIHSVWHYHLSDPDRRTRGLCGKQTMLTHLPLASWGVRGHLNESYCKECAEKGRDILLAAGVQLPSSTPEKGSGKEAANDSRPLDGSVAGRRIVVVPHPKLKREYVNRVVRTTREMANGYVKVPAGSVAVVSSHSPKGSTLKFDPCDCCKMAPIISAVGPECIEFIEVHEPSAALAS